MKIGGNNNKCGRIIEYQNECIFLLSSVKILEIFFLHLEINVKGYIMTRAQLGRLTVK